MKKQFLILAGSALILASCGSNENTESIQQAQIDSIAAANAALQDEINKQRNDSAINAIATAKAEAINAAENAKKPGKKTTKSTTTTTTVVETPPPPPPPPANPKEDRFKTNPDGSKTVDPSAPNKKADRFK